jgi:anti-anti-sigma regulatory factor
MPHIAAASPHFRCDSQAVAVDVVRVSLSGEIARSGEIDVSDAQAIDEVLSGAQAGAALTILDLRGLSAIEPTLLELVTAAGVRTREQGRRLVILHGPSAPRAEFEG